MPLLPCKWVSVGNVEVLATVVSDWPATNFNGTCPLFLSFSGLVNFAAGCVVSSGRVVLTTGTVGEAVPLLEGGLSFRDLGLTPMGIEGVTAKVELGCLVCSGTWTSLVTVLILCVSSSCPPSSRTAT